MASASYIILKFGTLSGAYKLWTDACFGIGIRRTISTEDFTILDDFFRNMPIDDQRDVLYGVIPEKYKQDSA